MEVVVTRTVEYGDELEHHGTKGMKWGRRLYQNPDGSLTELGKKRYNKQVEKLKAEEAKVKEAEKAAKTKQQTQAKLDELDAKKQELEERKKALKGKPEKESKAKPEETLEEKRERLLKSTDPKELYEGKDALTYQELSDRINRIDLENRLMSKIPVETPKTGKDYMDKATKNIESATNLYKSVDNAFGAVKNSHMGKMVSKYLGLNDVEEAFDFDSFEKNRDKKSMAKLKEVDERLKYYEALDKYKKKQSGNADDDNVNDANRPMEDYESFIKDIDNKTPNQLKTYSEAMGNKDKILGKQNQNNQNNNSDKTDKTDNANSNKNQQNKQSETKDTPNNEKKDDTNSNKKQQNKQSEPKKEQQSEKKSDPEPEIIEPTKVKQKSSDNSKKKGEDISDYVDWEDVSDDSPASKSVNEVVKKSGSTKLSDADYKQYQKDLKAWREKYDSENSSYSQKQMLEALYEIEEEYGLSLRKL